MEYNQIQYTLHHRTIVDAIKELLSNKEIFKYCVLDYNPEYKKDVIQNYIIVSGGVVLRDQLMKMLKYFQ